MTVYQLCRENLRISDCLGAEGGLVYISDRKLMKYSLEDEKSEEILTR